MRVMLLGFDSFDPEVFENLLSVGRMPNLEKYVKAGNYSRFIVSDPPQTEVSWTSIATGLDPGGHGIFDFVHRDPNTYTPYVSLLPTERKAFGTQFVPPHRTRTIFEEAARLGYPASSLWWPATFPARPELPVKTIPGLGTPDLLGRLGVGTLYTSTREELNAPGKTPVKLLESKGRNTFSGLFEGPAMRKEDKSLSATTSFQLEILDDQAAMLNFNSQKVELKIREWSPIFEVQFKMGFLMNLRSLTRAVLTQIEPGVRLYLLPLQIHPLASTWRYATPPGFVKSTWKECGPYLSLGWPQDTTGLEDGWISDELFLNLCESIFEHRVRVLLDNLKSFKEGLLGIVFDSLDRVQHMFRRDRPDLIELWYRKLDALVGQVENLLYSNGGADTRLIVLSDHGFANFDYKIHLNRWLQENGYLVKNNSDGDNNLRNIDWSRSAAYAVGLNSLYINQEGREGSGIVSPSNSGDLKQELQQKLLDWRDEKGTEVIKRAVSALDLFSGPFIQDGPDMLIGYNPGYRASQETGLGEWKDVNLAVNNDHWSGDHCIDSTAVPGVLFCDKGLSGITNPSYRDIPGLSIGKDLEPPESSQPPPKSTLDDEDQQALEERLKSLGYL
jgi:predicted AlkP superfamily phosphohydrolase/phosphomutase